MIQTGFDLTRLNTLRLSARAEAFATFDTVSGLVNLLEAAQLRGWPVRVLGGGSNVLLAGDIAGLVVQSAMQSVQLLEQTEAFSRVAVDAGLNWHDWVCRSIAYGHGLENLALIPGTVGAAPVQNIGAYGAEVADVLEAVEGVQISTRQCRTLSAADCALAYRDSVFRHELAGDFIITRVLFRLPRAFAPDLSYGPLAQLREITPKALIEAVCQIRRSKLPDPQQIPNAGSFFKNPVVHAEQAATLQQRWPSLPCYTQADGQVKLAAGWLIEQAGWKGRWLGHARMHDQQALVLTTDGKARFADVERLRDAVIAAVQEQFAVLLEPEPQCF